MDNYFDVVPDELILIIIGYVDLSNKSDVIPLTVTLKGFISIFKRNNELYNHYMNLVDSGYINNFDYLLYEEYLLDENISDHTIPLNKIMKDKYNIRLNSDSRVYFIEHIKAQEYFWNTNNLELLIFEKKYYHINHRISYDGPEIYRSYNINEYNTWKECITKISYSLLKKLYKRNNYDIIPNNVGRINWTSPTYY